MRRPQARIVNQRGFQRTTTFPDGTQESNTYEFIGNSMSHTDPNGQTTLYSGYDSQRRPKSTTHADGVSVLYSHDTGFKGKF